MAHLLTARNKWIQMNDEIAHLRGGTAQFVTRLLENLVWGNTLTIPAHVSLLYTRRLLASLGYQIDFVDYSDFGAAVITFSWADMEREMTKIDKTEMEQLSKVAIDEAIKDNNDAKNAYNDAKKAYDDAKTDSAMKENNDAKNDPDDFRYVPTRPL